MTEGLMAAVSTHARAIFRERASAARDLEVCSAARTLQRVAALKRSASPVPRLFHRQGPLDITGLVVTVIVDALQRVSRRWALADIANKHGNRLHPRRIDRDTASTVILIAFRQWIHASLTHGFPARILWHV